MRKLLFSIAVSAAVLGAAPLANAQALSEGQLVFGVEPVGAIAPVQDVQFLFGGRNYCWYPGGWHGPGFYWCGYAWRRGYGWGGPVGWHGWRAGGRGFHGGVAHGGPGFGHGGAGAHGGMAHAELGGGGHGGGGHGGGGEHGGGGHGGGGHHR